MPLNNIQPLQGLNKMSLSGLSDRERKQWYEANKTALAQYQNPIIRDQVANQMYKNQLFRQKFGEEEFNKTFGLPGSAEWRNQQLERRLVKEAIKNTFKPAEEYVTDINTGIPYKRPDGTYMTIKRDKKDVNISNDEYKKILAMDTQGLKDILEAYANGKWQPGGEVKDNNIFSIWNRATTKANESLFKPIVGEEGSKVMGAIADMFSLPGMIGHGRHEHNKTKNLNALDKIYDESNHRIAESPEVSKLKSAAYLDNSIVGANDEQTKEIFYNIIKPDYEKGNLGIPTYAAYFGDKDGYVSKTVRDISIDQMREIIATKYAMEKAGIPKDQVRDMLEREAQKHVADNTNWWMTYNKFRNDVAIAAASYTADKWNGVKNAYYAYKDHEDGGVNVWVDDEGNIIGEKDHPETTKTENYRVSWDNDGRMSVTSSYIDENGNVRPVHKEKITRSALLYMGRESDGENAGGKLESWADPEKWTKAEQYGVWTQDQIDKWDKIGASPFAMAWDPDETSHIMYDSFKMMSFGLADQALMFIPGGAGIAARAITSTSKLATASKATLELISKLGSASKVGQVLNNAAASAGIGYAYARGNAYEQFSNELMKQEEALRIKSEAELKDKYENDKDYKESIDNRIAQLKQSIIQNTLAENARQLESGSAVIDMGILEQQAEFQAYQLVQEEELQKQMEINKNTPEFQELHQNAINTVAYTSNLMAATDAAKYFALGAWGYRRYLYENPTGLLKRTGNTVKEAFKDTKNALKHVKEAKNAEGKLRLSTTVGKDFIGLKNQAKQLGKVYASQFGGGAWTNGTDDMQVDGVQQIEEDAMRQMYDSYISGEPTADVYGTLDQVSSFMTGMGRSLGQATTWHAALVGGLGSTISGNLNFANIASLATKEGRLAFKNQYETRYQRDNEGYIKYEERPVLDKDGKPIKGENGETITERVPVTEDINWKQNWRERLGFFLQNGVLNTYYGNKQAAMAKIDRVQAANRMLDEWGDFVDLEDYLSANTAGESVDSEREKRTSSLLKALRLARALDQIGKTQEGKRDVEDPLLKSSLVKQAKEFIEKANSIEVYDTGVNIGEFTPEEAENMLKEWYSRHPLEVRSLTKDVEVLRSIKENAQELTDAMKAYDEASDHVERSQMQSNKTFSTHVKNKMVEDMVLYNHWKNRLDKMRREADDNSAVDRALSTEEYIASVGGLGNAESLVLIYDEEINRIKAEDKYEIDKKVEASNKSLEAARNKYNNAQTADEKEQARKDVEQAYAKYDENLANQEYIDGLISRLQDKRDQAYNALEESTESYANDLQDVIGHLGERKQKDAINLARRIFTTRDQIANMKKGRKGGNSKITAKEDRALKRLRRQEQTDRKQLINALKVSDSQLNRFIERVGELNNINAQGRVLTADEIMSLDPVTRSKMLDVENRRLYSMAQLKEIDKLIGELNMKDPSILEKLRDIARLHQQMDMVMDSYKRLSQHPEGAALAIETDRTIAANAAYKLIDRRFAKDVANFIHEFDNKIIVNSTDESNDIVSALNKYHDRLLNFAGLVRFLETKAQLDDQIRNMGGKPSVTQRDKDNAVFQLLRTLNSRILDILDEEHLIDNYITELNKARRWVAVVEDIASVLHDQIMNDTRKENLEKHIFNLTFPCDDKESIMRVLEEEANNPTEPDFVHDILNLLDDLEELGHLRDATIVKLNAEKYKDAFKQKVEAQFKKNKDTADKAFSDDSKDDLEDFIANLDEPVRKALELILDNSKTRKLNESGSRYVINGKDYARVTSVKHLLKGSKLDKFDENSPWSLPSTSIGNSLDEFGRDVFNGIYDNMTEEQRLQEFEKRYSNSTAKNYEQVFQALKAFQLKLVSKNQRIIKLGNSADNQGSAVAAGTITVVMPDGTEKEIRIAGSLDVLAIDNKGNLHIYDFKTYRSGSLDIAEAVNKGYDRQLSMYAKLLEEEYGLKVASINIIPVKAAYPTPKNANKFNKSGAEYKKTNPNSNQLSVKEKGSSSFKEYREANFQVGNVFGMMRLGEERLTVDYASLSQEDKADVDKLPVETGQKTMQTPPSIPTEVTETNQDSEQESESTGKHDEINLGEDINEPGTQNVKVEPEIKQTDTEIEVDWDNEQGETKQSDEGIIITDNQKDPLYDEIVEFVQANDTIKTSILQRRYEIGYNRATRIIEALEKAGIVSAPKPNSGGLRDVLKTSQQADNGTNKTKPESETTDELKAAAEAQRKEQEAQETWSNTTSIKSTGTKDGKAVYGTYEVNMDDEGYLHVTFNTGNVAAKRGVSLKEINATKEEVFGKREDYDNPADWDSIPTDSKIGITSLCVSPNGYVVISTIYGIPKGAIAAQILYRAFPELRDYMSKFIVNQNENTSSYIEDASIDDVYYGSSKNPRKGTLRAVRSGDEVKFEIDGRDHSIIIDENDWVTSEEIIEERDDKRYDRTIGLSDYHLETLQDLGVNNNTQFYVRRLFKAKDGKWYAEGFFHTTAGNLPQIVELSSDFNINNVLQNFKELRNERYEKAIAKQQEINEEESDVKVHEENDAVWVESAEGNTQEAEASDKFHKSDAESQTLDNANQEDAIITTDAQQENKSANTDDTRILPMSGNANPVYWNTQTLKQGQEHSLGVDGVIEKRKGTRQGDNLDVFQALLDNYGIKLQDIIDEELAPIFMNNPDTPIKFMAVNWVSKEHSPTDGQLSTTCFLVVDYDSNVKRIHGDGKNGRKNNGGVVTVDGKEYLVIGTMGYGNPNSLDFSRKQSLWNSMFGRGSSTGFMKRAAGQYFMNPEHNNERFYVIKNENGEFYSTTIKEGSITPGWFVKAFEGQTPNRKVSISYLLQDPDGLGTNPLKLTWNTLNFGIAEYQQPWYTIDSRAVMSPGDLAKNAGTTFILIPAGNGKYAPVAIQPTMLSELKKDSPLEQRIDKLLDELLARNYNDRLTALKKLYRYLYLNSDKTTGKKNILLGKDNGPKANMISISIDGKIEKEFRLGDQDFNRQEFKEYVKNEMNPRINITPAILTNIEELKAYDASGALQTDVLMLRTMGSNFEIWPIGVDNKVLKPEKPIEQHTVENDRNRGIQIPYTGQFYTRNAEGLYRDQNGKEVTDASTIEDLEINRRIIESGIQPEVTEGKKFRYILDQSLENPLVVDIDRNSYKVTKLSTEEAVTFIQETIAKREQEVRDKAAKEALSKEKEIDQLIDRANPSKPDIAQQTREQELQKIEQSAYDSIINNLKDDEADAINSAITQMEGTINNPATSPELKAELKGYVRAYHEELARRQQLEQQPEPPKQPEVKNINQAQTSGTITFQQLIGNKDNLNRLMKALSKMPDAPRKIPELTDYLRKKKVEVDAIGNTEDDINAWFQTLEHCR